LVVEALFCVDDGANVVGALGFAPLQDSGTFFQHVPWAVNEHLEHL
jgi:hypothetical protein